MKNISLTLIALLIAVSAQCSEKVIVAIIDTGVDVNHPKLQGALWTNPGETGKDAQGRDKATNGIDDDGNGFIDDIHGFNFAMESAVLYDNHGHGTHIAGIIHTAAPDVQLMILKYYDPYSPKQNLANTARAIRYAIQMGAQVINYSGGGRSRDSDEYAAVLEAQSKGILVVAAAGNDGQNTDRRGFYPASYATPNLISVASYSPKRKESGLLESSNFGIGTVDIAAPGEDIISTLPNGKTGKMTGTSQATAFVSALVARLFATDHDYRSVKARAIRYGEWEKQLIGKVGSTRILSQERSLASRGPAQDAFEQAPKTNIPIFENASIWGQVAN